MGQTVGAIGDGLGKLFSNAGDVVKGTGQTVGELKDIGWTPQDMASMGLESAPSTGVAIGRTAISGALGGLSQMGNRGTPQGGGAPMQFLPQQELDPSLTDPQYAAQIEAQRRKQMFGY